MEATEATQDAVKLDLFESGWADAHSDHRDAALWVNPFYRGGYLAGATRPFACTSDDPTNHQGDTCPVHEGA